MIIVVGVVYSCCNENLKKKKKQNRMRNTLRLRLFFLLNVEC